MILKLNPLPKIPYVDGVPLDSNQTGIKWIYNGETLVGTSTKTSNDGNLNRSGVEIQKNAVQLEINTATQTSKINEVIDQVNLIVDNLEAISDESVVKKLDDAVTDISNLKVEVSGLSLTSATHTLKLKNINDEIGEYNPLTDPKHRTIRNDIIFLKTDLGSYAGFDVNGDVDITSTGSGLKYKVMQNALGVSQHEARITKIEDDWALSDVGQLTQELLDIRSELGPKGLATLESVYVRLNNFNTRLTTDETEITTINQYIGRTGTGSEGSIVNRMTSAETEITSMKTTIYDPVTGLVKKVEDVEGMIGSSTTPGGVKYDVAQAKRDIMDINMVLGESSDEGLRWEVANALTEIGDNSDPATMKGRILNLEETTRDNTSRLIDLESRVGNSSSGLVAANLVIGKDLYGDAESSDPFIKDGIKKVSLNLYTDVGIKTIGSETGIYKLISDLAARVALLETMLQSKANVSDVYTRTQADNKFVVKTDALAFTTNLVGPSSVDKGEALSLSVEVGGGSVPYSYQWKRGTVNVGINSATLTIDEVALTDAGVYSVVVTDAVNSVITSNSLTISINDI